MRITKVTPVGKRPVYDISVAEAEHYILENGVVTHNTGITYSADNIWIIGRQQEKDGTELLGYNFVINVEKSRYVKEKSKIPILVTHKGGVNKWSGLFDVALEGGYITKSKPGWYQTVNKKTGEVSEKSFRAGDVVDSDEFWDEMFKKTDIKDYIKNKYSIGSSIVGAEKTIIEDEAEE